MRSRRASLAGSAAAGGDAGAGPLPLDVLSPSAAAPEGAAAPRPSIVGSPAPMAAAAALGLRRVGALGVSASSPPSDAADAFALAGAPKSAPLAAASSEGTPQRGASPGTRLAPQVPASASTAAPPRPRPFLFAARRQQSMMTLPVGASLAAAAGNAEAPAPGARAPVLSYAAVVSGARGGVSGHARPVDEQLAAIGREDEQPAAPITTAPPAASPAHHGGTPLSGAQGLAAVSARMVDGGRHPLLQAPPLFQGGAAPMGRSATTALPAGVALSALAAAPAPSPAHLHGGPAASPAHSLIDASAAASASAAGPHEAEPLELIALDLVRAWVRDYAVAWRKKKGVPKA